MVTKCSATFLWFTVYIGGGPKRKGVLTSMPELLAVHFGRTLVTSTTENDSTTITIYHHRHQHHHHHHHFWAAPLVASSLQNERFWPISQYEVMGFKVVQNCLYPCDPRTSMRSLPIFWYRDAVCIFFFFVLLLNYMAWFRHTLIS